MSTYGSDRYTYVVNTLAGIEFDQFDIDKVYLIGSTSRKKARPDSDIDLLISFKGVSITDYTNPNSSVFLHEGSEQLVINKVKSLLGKDAVTKKQYDVQVVGSYELRFFDSVKSIISNAINLSTMRPSMESNQGGFMGISNIIKSVFPGLKKSEFHDKLRNVRTDVNDNSIKILDILVSSMVDRNPTLTNTTHHYVKRLHDSFYNLCNNAKHVYPKLFVPSELSKNDATIALIHNAIQSHILVFLNKIEKVVDEEFDEVIVNSGITYKKATILQSVALCDFISRYTKQMVHYLLLIESNEDKEYPKKEIQFLEDCLYTYVKALDMFMVPISKTIELIENSADIVIDDNNSDLVKSVFGSNALDPLKMESVISGSIKPSHEGIFGAIGDFTASVIASVIGGFFFTVGTARVNYEQMSYKKAKEEKKAIELRIELLKSKRDGNENPQLEKIIHNYEDQIYILAKKISDIEAKVI